MILFSKPKLILMWLLGGILCLIESYFLIRYAAPVASGGEGGLALFYEANNGASFTIIGTICYFLWFLLTPLVYSSQAIKARVIHFDYQLITRSGGLKAYWFRVLKTNAGIVFIYFLSIQLLRIVLITLFYAPFHFTKVSFFLTNQHYYIFKDGFWNLAAFLILSCLGQTIFSSLVLIVGMFLKNYVAYLPSGLVVGLTAILVSGIFLPFSPNSSSFLAHVVSLNAIITPGLQPIGAYAPTFNGGFVFILSFFLYGILCAGLFSLRMYLDKRNGH